LDSEVPSTEVGIIGDLQQFRVLQLFFLLLNLFDKHTDIQYSVFVSTIFHQTSFRFFDCYSRIHNREYLILEAGVDKSRHAFRKYFVGCNFFSLAVKILPGLEELGPQPLPHKRQHPTVA